MTRAPRVLGSQLFSRRVLVLSALQGLSVLVAALTVYVVAAQRASSPGAGRALAFATLIAGNVGLVFINRSWSESALRRLGTKNQVVWLVVPLAILALALALELPAARALFKFDAVGASELLWAGLFGLGSLAWFEAAKLLAPSWVRGRSAL